MLSTAVCVTYPESNIVPAVQEIEDTLNGTFFGPLFPGPAWPEVMVANVKFLDDGGRTATPPMPIHLMPLATFSEDVLECTKHINFEGDITPHVVDASQFLNFDHTWAECGFYTSDMNEKSTTSVQLCALAVNCDPAAYMRIPSSVSHCCSGRRLDLWDGCWIQAS